MIENASAKLKTEMDSNKNNPYIHVVGEFLLQHLNQNPQDAEKILVEDKTIGKSLNEMRKVAEKKKAGNCAVLTPPEGFKVVLEYFGIKGAVPPDMSAITAKPIAAEPKSEVDFDVRLEDLF